MTNKVVTIFLLLVVTSSMSAFAQMNAKKMIDTATPKNAIPFVSEDSVSQKQLKKNWTLDFSDEFNDNIIDTTKWNIETAVKKRVDITLFSDKNQVAEKMVIFISIIASLTLMIRLIMPEDLLRKESMHQLMVF